MVCIVVALHIEDQLHASSDPILGTVRNGVEVIPGILHRVDWNGLVVDKVKVGEHCAAAAVVGDANHGIVEVQFGLRVPF